MSAWRAVVLLSLAASCNQANECSYSDLLEHLKLSSYNEYLANVRPVKDWRQVTDVKINMVLYGIFQVDEKLQTFTSHVSINTVWENDFLRWKPSDFCNITEFTFPSSKLWTPDINIQEDASDTGSIHKSEHVSVFATGMIHKTAHQRLTSTCTLNLWNFPFDQQSCNITFSSMISDGRAIRVRALAGDELVTNISEQFMVTRGEWSLKHLEITHKTEERFNWSSLVYQVRIVRKPMLYVINFIIPLFYLLMLDVASFFIGEARGEKLSFKITVLLSISVLLLILKDLLPSTEDRLPIIANFCVGVFGLVGLSVLEAMLVSFLIDLDDKFPKKSTRVSNREVPSEKQEKKDPVKEKAEGLPIQPGPPSQREQLRLVLQEVLVAQREVASAANAPRPKRFRRVAEIIDLIFFIFYFVTVVIFLAVSYHIWIPPDFYS
ncbi:5-hydroxytryptamine receptor 3A [Syngnathus scovelli]|uniref:5-hydroxytryptamine receptor 3A n=1 Tax=Syngnathus scovelli TaxID=161590 RepID=UPI00210F3A2B|nr:5-hydroxytryptamine receptor 3A [Syngnathus scovelli]